MEILLLILASLAVSILILYAISHLHKNRRKVPSSPIEEEHRRMLEENVVFYAQLDDEQKAEFEKRVHYFLSTVTITGVNTEVEELDKLLVASSAIIPIFGFKDWEYININEVLLYPDSFDEAFAQQGSGRTTLGMVGTGPYQNSMILSQHELRQGFLNKTAKTNTAIHEFVHLVDKTDGAVDGLPEALMAKQYVIPWLNLLQQKISEILKNKTDINPYGATNKAEFFAVVSEYFFERPDLLQQKHPELYELLSKIFKQEPQTENK
jgi:MtfA peptidase